MFVGGVIAAAVYIEKEPEKTDASKLAPIFSGFFFCVLRGLLLCCAARLFAHTPPRALRNAGRWRSHRIREADRKRLRQRGKSLLFHSMSEVFFV